MNQRERATVLAALRYWQTLGIGGDKFRDISTDGGQFTALHHREIDDLCEVLNHDDHPTVVINTEGGAIHNVSMNAPVRLLDADVEGSDQDKVEVIDGQRVWVGDWFPYSGYEAMESKEYVDRVLAQHQES